MARKPTAEDFAGMTVNERLAAAGLLDAFYEAVANRDSRKLREILGSLHIGLENVEAIVRSQIGEPRS